MLQFTMHGKATMHNHRRYRILFELEMASKILWSSKDSSTESVTDSLPCTGVEQRTEQ